MDILLTPTKSNLNLIIHREIFNPLAAILVLSFCLHSFSQHDIPECLLRGALDGVVEDCVSFVGVDLNIAGVSMLR